LHAINAHWVTRALAAAVTRRVSSFSSGGTGRYPAGIERSVMLLEGFRAQSCPRTSTIVVVMSNHRGVRVASQVVVLWSFPLIFACSRGKQADPSAAQSSEARAAPSAAIPQTAPGASYGPAPAVIDRQTAVGIEQSCKGICEHSNTLKCARAADCMKNCLGMGIGTPCSESFAALYACLQREPPAHWECGEDGIAAIREGYCEKEQERTVICMEAKAQP
jgi:hypothetical protein